MSKPNRPPTRPQPGTLSPPGQKAKPPSAPPVYRPQSVPVVLQRKASAPAHPPPATRRVPAAPAPYRPQIAPKVLQAKKAAGVPQPHATQTKRTPVAPPVYRPQPPPRVLQTKKATVAPIPMASNSTASNKKVAVTPSPALRANVLQASRAPSVPKAAPSARAHVRPAPPTGPRARTSSLGGIIQRKLGQGKVNAVRDYIIANPNVVGVLNYEWGASEEDPGLLLSDDLLLKNYNVLKKGLEDNQAPVNTEHLNQISNAIGSKKERTLNWKPPVVQVAQVQAVEHLDDFHRNTDRVQNSHNPQDVLGLITVTGANTVEIGFRRDDAVDYGTAQDNQLQSQITEIKKPNNTENDGEVAVLVRALKYFTKQMQTEANQNKQMTFTLAISGPEGPCDDCRARLVNFVAYWKQKVRTYIDNGIQANLKITSKYFKAPGLRNSGRYYGWQADAANGPPYLHTITETERGQNA
jgi:hypothetical protein